jgi:hypothetical protein
MSASICAILHDEYGIEARPSKKVTCPSCNHATLSVKSDDKLAKCFHPGCGEHITIHGRSNDSISVLSRILMNIYRELHKALIALADIDGKNAYDYCVNARNIHQQVVEDSMLGMVAVGFSVDKYFVEEIEKAEVEVAAEQKKSEPKGASRPKKNPKLVSATEKLELLNSAAEKLGGIIKGKDRWLVLFYTDAHHRIVSMKFREPYTKEIRTYKPTAVNGVFNAGIFRPYRRTEKDPINQHFIVFEGDFNQLQFQSMLVRKAVAENRDCIYAFACAVGGVNTADVETIRRLSPMPIICSDNDGGAGLALIESVRRATAVTAFTTPLPFKDMDDYILSFGEDNGKAFDSVVALIASRQFHSRPYEGVKAELDIIRRNQGDAKFYKAFEVNRSVSEKVVADLKERGRFYSNNSLGYIFLLEDKRLLAILPDDRDLAILLSGYGIGASESIYTHVIDAMIVEAAKNGIKAQIHDFAFFNRETFTLYLFNYEQQIFRITSEKIELVDNGDDGVLFLQKSSFTPFKLEPAVQGESALDHHLLATMQFEGNPFPEDDCRLLYLMWVLSLFFPQLFRHKVIMAFVGDHGSGKSLALRKPGIVIFGPCFDVTPMMTDIKDFDAAVTNDPYVALDNADTKVHWLEDRLATASTGGNIEKRIYFTTNSLVKFPIKAYLGITSRDPHFTRPDVAQRLLLLKVKQFKKFVPEENILSDLDTARNPIMSEIVGYLQEIIQALTAQSKKDYNSGFRIGDFASFCLKIAHHQGWGKHMEFLLNQLVSQQTSFTTDADPLLELLSLWVGKFNGENIYREVDARKLRAEFNELSEMHRISCTLGDTAQEFGVRLNQRKAQIEAKFIMTIRTVHGSNHYRFKPKPTEIDEDESDEREVPANG